MNNLDQPQDPNQSPDHTADLDAETTEMPATDADHGLSHVDADASPEVGDGAMGPPPQGDVPNQEGHPEAPSADVTGPAHDGQSGRDIDAGRRCSSGHWNPPKARFCMTCCEPLDRQGVTLQCEDNLGQVTEFQLDEGSHQIGKQADSDVPLSGDSYTSRQHARLTLQDGRVLVEDLGSANGTFLRLQNQAELQVGDELVIGTTVVRLMG